MEPEKLIYTDGHDVVITDKSLNVSKKSYKINGILAHWLNIIRPDRLPWATLGMAGVILCLAGYFRLFPSKWNFELQQGTLVDVNQLLMWSALSLTVLCLIIVLLLRERYTLRISTAEGERDVVVSRSKDYIGQIVAAIDRAVNYRRSGDAENELHVSQNYL